MKVKNSVLIPLGFSAILGLTALTGCGSNNVNEVQAAQITETSETSTVTETEVTAITTETAAVSAETAAETETSAVSSESSGVTTTIEDNTEITSEISTRSREEVLTEPMLEMVKELYKVRSTVLDEYNVQSFGEDTVKAYKEGTLSEAERAEYESKMFSVVKVGVLTIEDTDYLVSVQRIGNESEGRVTAYICEQGIDVSMFYTDAYTVKTQYSEESWEDALNKVKFYDYYDNGIAKANPDSDYKGSILSYNEYVYNEAGDVEMQLNSLHTGYKASGKRTASGKCTIDYADISMEELPGSDETHLDLSSLTELNSYFTWLPDTEY